MVISESPIPSPRSRITLRGPRAVGSRPPAATVAAQTANATTRMPAASVRLPSRPLTPVDGAGAKTPACEPNVPALLRGCEGACELGHQLGGRPARGPDC